MMLLVFTLDDWRCALDISAVERIYRAVAVTPMPEAPDVVLGIVDVHGKVLPVVSLRKRFRLAEKKPAPSDRLIVAHTSKRRLALVADAVSGVVECRGDEITSAESILPGLEYVEGVVRTKTGMILVHDLDGFLSLEEENRLDRAMDKE